MAMTYAEALRKLNNTFMVDNEYRQLLKDAVIKQMSEGVIPIKRTAHDFQSDICKHSHYPCEHIRTYNTEYQYTDYLCPACRKRVSDGTPSYCDKCGQALDWSRVFNNSKGDNK